MKIEVLQEKDKERYEQLVIKYGTVFNRLDWLSMFEQTVVYGIYDKGSKLVGGFHLHNEKRWGMNFLRNTPYTPFIGPFFEDPSKNAANRTSFRKNIIQALVDFVESDLSFSVCSFSLHKDLLDTQPFIWKDFKVSPNYTYQTSLNASEEELKAMLSPEKRNDISKALKDMVEVKECSDYQLVFDLVLKTFDRKNKGIEQEQVKKILFEFANPFNSFAFVSYKNNQPSAATFCIHDTKTAYYLLSGYDQHNKHHGAGPLALWNSIIHARQKGLEVFDFEGSMIKPIESYFRGFGGDIVPYFTINKAWLPLEIALKFTHRSVF